MGWKIVEIQEANTLKLFLGNLVIYKDQDKITIPISDIDVLLINNYKINVSIQLLNAFSDNNTLVIFCNNKCMPQTYVLPIFGNYNTLKIFNNQLKWNHKFKSNLWVSIIKQKIENQIIFLYRNDFPKERIELISKFKKEIKSYDITNREGHASKVYWNIIYGNDFSRDKDIYINTLLNYGYTVLHGYLSRSIIKKGLDPRISIFHKSFHNHFSLSSDLVEPFRILIDQKVYEIIKKGEGNMIEHKKELVNVFNTKIKINNTMQFVNNAIDIYLDAIVNQTDFPTFDFYIDDK